MCALLNQWGKASNFLLIVLSFSPVNRQTDTHKEGEKVLDELPPLTGLAFLSCAEDLHH